jgi:phosphoglycolate phosphatase
LAREGFSPVPFDSARGAIGGGARRMIQRALAAEGRALPPAELDRLFSDFIAHYAEHIADRSRPFPQLEAALDRLVERGCRLAVCTNKLEWLAVRLLQALGLAHRFAAICGQDTFGTPKPDPQALRGTILRARGTLTQAVMVGDSATDIDTARAAGVPVIAVDFGYTDVPVTELCPDRVISSFDQLPTSVFELLAECGRTVSRLGG